MLDPNTLVGDHYTTTLAALQRKGVEVSHVEQARDAITHRRQITTEIGQKKALLNKQSTAIGELMRSGAKEAAAIKRAEVTSLKASIQSQEAELRQAEDLQHQMLLRLPNLPDTNCPDGQSEADNVVVRHENYDPDKLQSKHFEPHWNITERLGLLDKERAAKLSGSMFAILKGDGARLLRALVQFALDLNRPRYEELVIPHFVSSETLKGTGHLPKFADDAFHVTRDDLWAIPTGEVPLTAYHSQEIFAAQELPKRYMAYTSCFRREAGSAGKDTRGLQRLHEFHKVELVHILTAETEAQGYADLLADCERALQILELPYRVLDLCAGDLTFASSRVYDLEVYAPGVQKWLECSSVGCFTDFQARRCQIRYRPTPEAKPEIARTLNGSALATPRVIAAILENGLQTDGSVKLPEALHDYMKQTHLKE